MKQMRINRNIIITGVLLAAMANTAAGQKKDGGISEQMLSEIKAAQTTSAADKALFNALASNSIDNLAKNHANAGEFDTYFSNETKSQSITDQKSSGRCWMFSGMNVLRADFAKRTDSLTVDFSQDYLFFWDQLEKSNLFLQGVIDCAKKPMDDERVRFFFQNPIGDGGTFCGLADLADKYGLVPRAVMPETYSAENTTKMRTLIKSKLREFGLQLRDMVSKGKKADAIAKEKTKMLGTIYHMLAITLGEPVQEFTYSFKDSKGRSITEPKKYTPLSFYKEIIGGEGINGTFIMVMNDPRREYYQTYEVEYDRHTYDGHNWKYLNLPMEEIAQLAITSIKDGKKLYSSYDVSKFLDRKRGYSDIANFDYESLFGTTFGMDKAQRIMTFDSGSTHAMTLTAVDLDEQGKPKKWKVENSWGADWGQRGCLIMTNQWFNEYMFRLVVDKKYVPENILKMSEKPAVMVMPEDPLFAVDD